MLVTASRRAQELTDAAADYLSRGLAVIALTGKTPNVSVHRNGIYNALRGAPETEEDWHVIGRAFCHDDTTGVGILTGLPYVVVDIDGEEGAEQWQEINGDKAYVPLIGGPMTPDRWVAKTGRGLHLWYAPPEELLIPQGMGVVGPGGLKLGPKLDLKGYGGYVAAPPSRHPDGHTYEWLVPPGEDAPMEAPEALSKVLRYHSVQKERRLGAKEQRRAIPVTATFAGTTYTSIPSFDGIIESVRKAEEGNRNHMLHWAAASMADEGANSEDYEALYDAAIENGLERQETKRTIQSAIRHVNG